MSENIENSNSRENKNFVMFYRDFMDEVADMAGENITAYRLFMLLCKHMDGGNALIISMTALTELMGLSRQTISKAVKYLSNKGWICVMKSGTSNVYIVNPQVAWTSYASQKSACKFRANVILCGSENTEYLNNKNAFHKFKTIDTEFINSIQNRTGRHNEDEVNL